MLDAMLRADVGDDVFGQDPTVNALEAQVAAMFGHERALFCPSGTMTNQIAIRIHTRPLDELICDEWSHVYLYELGGYSVNSGVSISVVRGTDGKITPAQIVDAIRPEADWYPRSRLVTIENSCNRAGGTYYTLEEMRAISETCASANLALHLDGARLFNVLVETGDAPAHVGPLFDTISICLSKGLGAPVGSILIGSESLIRRARKVRKVLGGGMRQAGYLAAAGLYALEHHIDRLREDNMRARQIGQILATQPYVSEVLPVHTNIVIFKVTADHDVPRMLDRLKVHGITAAPMSHDTIRFVFHLDITERMMRHLEQVLDKIGGEEGFGPAAPD